MSTKPVDLNDASTWATLPKRRKEAQALGSKYYFTGERCQREHIAPRFTSVGKCAFCARVESKAAYQADPAAGRQKNHEAYARNGESLRASSRRWKDRHPEKVKAQNAARDKETLRQQAAAYRAADPERAREIGRRTREKHRDKRNANTRAWRERNPDKVAANNARWRAANPAQAAAMVARRHAALRQATPPWIVITDLEPIYQRRIDATAATGVTHHVDHIVPLRGYTPEGYPVSGLNVPWNLRVATGAENMKRNRYMTIKDEILAIAVPEPKEARPPQTLFDWADLTPGPRP